MADWSALVLAVAQARDRKAFALLYAHFAPRLKGYFMRLGTPADIAEDLAQEAFIAVWGKAASFEPLRASASTWIFTIARNLRVDRLRRDARSARGGDDDEIGEDPPVPIDHVIERERERSVRAALRRLPPEQFEIIRQSFFEERPHSEIATALDIPLGTVKSRVRLAMARLRALVRDLA